MEKMIIVGVVWGTTNALMRKGTLLWDQTLSSNQNSPNTVLRNCLNLLLTWQYTLPFLLNLSASAAFFSLLGSAPLSVAVPVTNATTFAATAVAGVALGEEVRVREAVWGTLLILGGVYVCVM